MRESCVVKLNLNVKLLLSALEELQMMILNRILFDLGGLF